MLGKRKRKRKRPKPKTPAQRIKGIWKKAIHKKDWWQHVGLPEVGLGKCTLDRVPEKLQIREY